MRLLFLVISIILFLIHKNSFGETDSINCEYECCIELMYSNGNESYISKTRREFLNDTLFIDTYYVPGQRIPWKDGYIYKASDTFKLVNNVSYLMFEGTFYRLFSESDFKIGIPMMSFLFPPPFIKVEIHISYPLAKIITDTFNIYTFKTIVYFPDGKESFSYPKMKIFYIPELGIIRREYYDSGNVSSYAEYVIKSERCDEFLDRVFNRKSE